MKYAWTSQHRDSFPVAVLCDVLLVSISGDYGSLGRRPRLRANRHQRIRQAVHAESHGTYGSHKVTRILGHRVRLGRPLRVQGLPQATTVPAFAASVGLCLFAAHPQDEWWDFEIPSERIPARSLKRAIRWFRDNW